jgi:hypothetical protein
MVCRPQLQLIHGGPWSSKGGALTGVAPFGYFGRLELTAIEGKGRREQRGSHQGLQRPEHRQSEASDDVEQQQRVVLGGSTTRAWRRGGRHGYESRGMVAR